MELHKIICNDLASPRIEVYIYMLCYLLICIIVYIRIWLYACMPHNTESAHVHTFNMSILCILVYIQSVCILCTKAVFVASIYHTARCVLPGHSVIIL